MVLRSRPYSPPSNWIPGRKQSKERDSRRLYFGLFVALAISSAVALSWFGIRSRQLPDKVALPDLAQSFRTDSLPLPVEMPTTTVPKVTTLTYGASGGDEATVPTPTVPTPTVSTPGVPTPGVPTPGVPTPGVPTPGVPTPGVPAPAMPTPGVPTQEKPGARPFAIGDFMPGKIAPPVHPIMPAFEVNNAVRRGVAFFADHPERWLRSNRSPLGYAALPALALLESGIRPDDPLIREAARQVRERAPGHDRTYEIALAILLLDRLNDSGDGALIRSLALRLIAGQESHGGWTYTCPPLGELEEPLETALRKTRPRPRLEMPLAREAGKGLLDMRIIREDNRTSSSATRAFPNPAPELIRPFDVPDDTDRIVEDLPLRLKSLPVFEWNKTPESRSHGRDSDNSNTQFAILALWAARRHGIPVERSLLLADQRFAQSQHPDGSWGYHLRDAGRPSMTCVGLLGLATGHGAFMTGAKMPERSVDDPAIRSGIECLARSVGDVERPGPLPDLYFLWSLERAAMLYRLSSLDGKDWYGWGARMLVRDQRADGSWLGGQYPGTDPPIDTAFALLFLSRSNLAKDLTDHIRFRMPLDSRPSKPVPKDR